MVELCLATRNMASSEEGSTHTRTIQKRAKKTQDQACQFDASLLEGERYCYFFFAYTLSVFLGRWTQCLCDVTSVTQSIKYFLLFAFFRGNWNLWSLQPNFWVRKVGLDWYCFMSDSKDLGLRDCELFFAPQRVVLCRRNLSVPVPRGLAISNSLGSLFSDVFFLDFILKHLAGWVKCCIIFFFSENFACDTENGESRLKFRDISETGNGESLKFQGNFGYSLCASRPVFRIYPVYCVSRHCFKLGLKKSAVQEVLAIEASRFRRSILDVRMSGHNFPNVISFSVT